VLRRPDPAATEFSRHAQLLGDSFDEGADDAGDGQIARIFSDNGGIWDHMSTLPLGSTVACRGFYIRRTGDGLWCLLLGAARAESIECPVYFLHHIVDTAALAALRLDPSVLVAARCVVSLAFAQTGLGHAAGDVSDDDLFHETLGTLRRLSHSLGGDGADQYARYARAERRLAGLVLHVLRGVQRAHGRSNPEKEIRERVGAIGGGAAAALDDLADAIDALVVTTACDPRSQLLFTLELAVHNNTKRFGNHASRAENDDNSCEDEMDSAGEDDSESDDDSEEGLAEHADEHAAVAPDAEEIVGGEQEQQEQREQQEQQERQRRRRREERQQHGRRRQRRRRRHSREQHADFADGYVPDVMQGVENRLISRHEHITQLNFRRASCQILSKVEAEPEFAADREFFGEFTDSDSGGEGPLRAARVSERIHTRSRVLNQDRTTAESNMHDVTMHTATGPTATDLHGDGGDASSPGSAEAKGASLFPARIGYGAPVPADQGAVLTLVDGTAPLSFVKLDTRRLKLKYEPALGLPIAYMFHRRLLDRALKQFEHKHGLSKLASFRECLLLWMANLVRSPLPEEPKQFFLEKLRNPRGMTTQILPHISGRPAGAGST
jgi:hypothetical protein